LGSAVANDTLNALLFNDHSVAERTCGFVTFGSPLDKIVFLSSIQGDGTSVLRDGFTHEREPLIRSYRQFRRFPWINIHTWNDPISDRIRFYDVPGLSDDLGSGRHVENIIDLHALLPLVSHSEYWGDTAVWASLYALVTR
jgi:hypothetical protein